MKRFFIPVILSSVILLASCDKYLDITPTDRVIPKTSADYRQMMTSAYNSFPEHRALLALRTDELQLDEFADDATFYKDIFTWNDLNPNSTTITFPYQAFYRAIFYANSLIDNAINDAGDNVEVRQMVGEAYLLRAYCHFELLNIYSKPYDKATAATDRGVPMSLKLDLEQTYVPATVESVYQQILSDIENGQKLVTVESFAPGKNYQFTKRAALAFKARVYEYRGEWEAALAASREGLEQNNRLEDLNDANSKLPNNYQSAEAILSLENTLPALVGRSVYINQDLINSYTSSGDLRLSRYFVEDDGVYKSDKTASSDLRVSFRNAELYLIEAEAAFHTGNVALAKETLLALKAKRYTPDAFRAEQQRISILSGDNLLNEILSERTRELALEGHRWYDLRRYGQPRLVHSFNGEDYVLQKNDSRYTIRFPREVIAVNPNLQ